MTDENGKLKSDKILEDLKKNQEGNKIVEVEEKKVKLVIFTLMDSYFAFYGDDVKEILPILNIYFVPGSPDYILGIVNVRGDIQSVLDINIVMGLGKHDFDNDSRIIIAEKKNIRSGIQVDSVVDVLDLAESSIRDTISTLNDNVSFFVAGEISYKDRNVTLLDVGKLFEKITQE